MSKICQLQGLRGCGSITCSGKKFKEAALERSTARLYATLPTGNGCRCNAEGRARSGHSSWAQELAERG